jgi:tetratricopeptide (TPR) repeat protein
MIQNGGQLNPTDCDVLATYIDYLNQAKKTIRSFMDSSVEMSDICRKNYIELDYMIDAILKYNFSKLPKDSFFPRFMKTCIAAMNNTRTCMPVIDAISMDDLCANRSQSVYIQFADIFRQSNQPSESMTCDQLESNMNESFTEDNPYRKQFALYLADLAVKEKDYDRAIGYLRNGLSVSCVNGHHALLYWSLVRIYKKQKNWRAALDCYDKIINMKHLSVNSPILIKAYTGYGDVCKELGDYNKASLSYKHAIKLQSQFPVTSETQMKIADIYTSLGDTNAALKIYEEVIGLGHSVSVSEAYQNMGIIYMKRKDYDKARSYFNKSLEVPESNIYQDPFYCGLSHLYLADIEHLTGCHEKRDFHINQVLIIAESVERGGDELKRMIQSKLDRYFATTR